MSDEVSVGPIELRVALVTLGCARNDVDSEELAARLEQDGWQVVEDPDDADAVLVNTCGFIQAAKKDSIDTVLDLQDGSRPVVAVGCLAQRYGSELAEALPEADAVLGFDAYPDIASQLRRVVAGERPRSHEPVDRRLLLPITPVDRHAMSRDQPGHWHGRTRLESGPIASLKIASGCDRRCTFCAIPTFRGSLVSRPGADVLAEAQWLVEQGVRELNLVSENSTSYGKDLGDARALEGLLPELAALDRDIRIRLAYLQPAEMWPGLVEAMTTTPGVARYFDLSFQHASPDLLRRMKRFGGAEDFLSLIEEIRSRAPDAGIRTNVIVGFPGETEQDFGILQDFLESAQLDAVGVFGYSDEEGTAASGFAGKVAEHVIAQRVEAIATLVADVADQRADTRVGSEITVLVESVGEDSGAAGAAVYRAVGRAEHQGPEDGETVVLLADRPRIGQVVRAKIMQTAGVDLVAQGV
ncbi:MAG: 30S ribosomal protein S12 methylthiotransferase RimO [Actinomycetes bacterium]